jgi:hypothetical protein
VQLELELVRHQADVKALEHELGQYKLDRIELVEAMQQGEKGYPPGPL